jgi:formylmethanofuran dehydrogenase subunit E
MNNLNDFTKEQLVGLLQKANNRRKTVERNMRNYNKRHYLSDRLLHTRLRQWEAEHRKWQEREWEILHKENEYKQWRDNVNELVNKETAEHNALFAVQKCSHCEEKKWRKKYRETYSGMSEFCGKYINIVDDMMRQKNLPDNVKARLCDMRIAFIESREFLDKVIKENDED